MSELCRWSKLIHFTRLILFSTLWSNAPLFQRSRAQWRVWVFPPTGSSERTPPWPGPQWSGSSLLRPEQWNTIRVWTLGPTINTRTPKLKAARLQLSSFLGWAGVPNISQLFPENPRFLFWGGLQRLRRQSGVLILNCIKRRAMLLLPYIYKMHRWKTRLPKPH